MNRIFSISGASPHDVWAVGPGGTQYDRLQHYDGIQWSTYKKEVIWCDAQTLYALSGRSEMDIFQSMKDGIAHYNGTDIEYIYKFPVEYMAQVRDPLIFSNEVFFCIDNPLGTPNKACLILHGTLRC